MLPHNEIDSLIEYIVCFDVSFNSKTGTASWGAIILDVSGFLNFTMLGYIAESANAQAEQLEGLDMHFN